MKVVYLRVSGKPVSEQEEPLKVVVAAGQLLWVKGTQCQYEGAKDVPSMFEPLGPTPALHKLRV